MEPQAEVPMPNGGVAPLVGWTPMTASLKSSPSKTPMSARDSSSSSPPPPPPPPQPRPPTNSCDTSGIGGETPTDKSSDSAAYSPTRSSVGSQYASNNNIAGKPPPPASEANGDTVITVHPVYDGVKFDIAEKDSIISSSRSSLTSSSEDSDKPRIPDGGWGWVVVVASLMISMVADGISFSFGLLYIEFLHEYDESKSKTAWIGSLFMAVPLLSGPIMSALVDKYGCRTMTMLGGLISAFGFILSSLSNSIELQFLNFGVIAGLGLGLCYVTAVVSIAYWFDKKRTLACSLGACGTGIGTFVYAPMTQYFIDEYGWRGTTLLLAGTFLNMCVCGAAMRAPEWWTEEQNRQASIAGKSIRAASSCGSISGARSMGAESNFPGVEEIRKMLKSGETPEYILTTLATSMAMHDPPEVPEKQDTTGAYRSVVNLPTFIKQSERVPIEVLESLSSNKRLYNVILENYPSLLMCRSYSDKGLNKIPETAVPARVPVTMSMRLKQTKRQQAVEQRASEPTNNAHAPLLDVKTDVKIMKPVLKKQSSIPQATSIPRNDSGPWLRRQFSTHQTNYLKNIKVHRNSVMYRGAMLNIKKYRLRASSCPDIYRNSMITLPRDVEQKWYSDILELLKGMADFSMFLELHFLLMSISTILLFTWFIVPYFYLAEYVTRHGYSENEASKLISIIGITSTVGMIGLGWAGDQPWMNVTKTYFGCLVCCGVATAGMPLCTSSYLLLCLTCAFFGLFFASTFSFTPVIVVQLIPLERFTTAYGLILMCQGIGNLLGPPLGGWVFDMTGTWDLSFHLAGFWIIISGVLIAIIPMTKNRLIWGDGVLEKDVDRVSIA